MTEIPLSSSNLLQRVEEILLLLSSEPLDPFYHEIAPEVLRSYLLEIKEGDLLEEDEYHELLERVNNSLGVEVFSKVRVVEI